MLRMCSSSCTKRIASIGLPPGPHASLFSFRSTCGIIYRPVPELMVTLLVDQREYDIQQLGWSFIFVQNVGLFTIPDSSLQVPLPPPTMVPSLRNYHSLTLPVPALHLFSSFYRIFWTYSEEKNQLVTNLMVLD